MTLQVSADTSERAREQAIQQAHAMGYSRVAMARVVRQDGPRTYSVQLDVVK